MCMCVRSTYKIKYLCATYVGIIFEGNKFLRNAFRLRRGNSARRSAGAISSFHSGRSYQVSSRYTLVDIVQRKHARDFFYFSSLRAGKKGEYNYEII